ncbi:acyl-CoA thioesterase I [Burkholderiales bacterium]|nr:acyl-CoA thioesterase I [Burkholderiales bacterium]
MRIVAAIALLLLALPLSAAGAEPTLLVFGDSLAAGFGLARGEGWVDLLQQKLKREGYGYRVVNASISGETTSGGRARIDSALKNFRPQVVVLELGANDGLRGTPLASFRDNLDAIAAAARRSGAKLLIVGMRLPANYGAGYTQGFAAVFAEVAKKHQAALLPFLFAGLEDTPESFLPDRLHPSALAQPRILDTVWPALRPLLGKAHKP